MASVSITLPDGSKKDTEAGTSSADFVKNSIGPGLAKAAVFAKLNGQEVDLARTIDADASLQIFTSKNPEALEVTRHDAAHIVASAVQELFPGTQVTIGPVIEEGFYYDFYREHLGKPAPFTPDELAGAARDFLDSDEVAYTHWGESQMGKIAPLWLLRQLPNMPACHVAIEHDARGPNNTITSAEAPSAQS